MNLPTAEDIIRLHEVVIRRIGGSEGLRDAGALRMCAEKPRTAFGGKEMYPTLFLKAAALLESIARNHPFVDGNKRTAFLSALAIIERNGCETAFNQKDIEDTVLKIVTEKLPIEEIAAWLEKNSKKADPTA
ncbi:MAG: type II toxin-antitoxin system death-on-curing family toxin [bacterium]|nr:type II toxin-antitoxin system death-on-curing family toxin [bacterium]